MAAISTYINMVLLVLVCIFGYLSYDFYGDKNALSMQLTTVNGQLKLSEDAVKNADQSCKSAQTVTHTVNQSINKLQEGMTKQLEGLAALPATIPQGDDNEGSKETTGGRVGYSDNSKLSPSLMQLLDDAYCSTAKDDPSCSTK